MRLLSTGALWWLLLSAVIIFFYLLKLKRSRRVVPSVFLWGRALEEMEANAPFKKLRRSLLLLLQLLALAALVFALARPLVNLRSLASGSSILIVDSTASMSTRDEGGRSRLDRAKELAREMVAGLGGGDRAAIIESSSRVTVRSPLTSDRAALASAIDSIEETDAPGNLSDALQLAEQIAKSERDASVIVIGDGSGATLAGGAGSDISGTLERAAAPALRFVRVGQRADNVGIIALNSRPARSNAAREMFASVANFSGGDRAVDLELRVDGKLVDARGLSVGANARTAVLFNSLPAAGGLAELRLKVDDDLESDDVAYTLLPDARRPRVGVSAENLFLLQALAVNSDIDALRMSAGAPVSEFDCVVSEGQVGAGLVESDRPLLLVNPSDVAGVLRAGGNIERPEITQFEERHPVNSFLNYADLHIESAAKREAAAWLRPVAGSASDGLIWAGDDGRRRVVVIGFDLAKSDLPLKVEFPILLANSIAWLSGRDALASERAVRAGQPVSITLPAAPPAPAENKSPENEKPVTVRMPGGEERELSGGDGPLIFADTMRVGAYEVSGAPPFAASLLSESESDNAPRDAIQTRAGEVGGQAETFSSEREAWRWIALLAIALLSVEWLVYHRRITA